MSYILDALRKAEHDRRNGQQADLRSLQPHGIGTKKNKIPMIAALLTMNILLLAGGFAFYRQQITSSPVAVAPPKQVPVKTVHVHHYSRNNTEQKPLLVDDIPLPDVPPPSPISSNGLNVSADQPLDLAIHVYSKDPRKRFVQINNRRYREGDRINDRLLVEAILPNGVRLNYQGNIRFLAAGLQR